MLQQTFGEFSNWWGRRHLGLGREEIEPLRENTRTALENKRIVTCNHFSCRFKGLTNVKPDDKKAVKYRIESTSLSRKEANLRNIMNIRSKTANNKG